MLRLGGNPEEEEEEDMCKLILVIIAFGVILRLHYYLCISLLLNITVMTFLKSGLT